MRVALIFLLAFLQGCAVAAGAGLGVLVSSEVCRHPATAAQHKWLCGP